MPASSALAVVVNSVYLFAVVVWGVKLKLSEIQAEKLLAQQKAVQLIELGVRFDEKPDEYGNEIECVEIPPHETPASAPDNFPSSASAVPSCRSCRGPRATTSTNHSKTAI